MCRKFEITKMSLDEKEYNDGEPCKPSLDAPHVAGMHLGGSAAWQDHLISLQSQEYQI